MTQEISTEIQYAQEVWPTVTARYLLTELLHDTKTPFQCMQIVQSEHYGRMLLLDGMVQTTEKDEFVYHEMMTHVPMMAHPNPKSVLIIGGGDGGILREVLRHDSVERAVMVEIDQRVIDFCKEELPSISAGAFDDKRAEIVIDDGAKYVKETKETFDVIIVDSPDPIGPATTLFTEEFYRNLASRLNGVGVMSRQTGSTFMQPEELQQTHEIAAPNFDYAHAYVFAVPTYIGGLFSSLICANGIDPLGFDINRAMERYSSIGGGRLSYYSPGVHFGALQLPGYVAKKLTGCSKPSRISDSGITFGWELTLDLYDCDQHAISTEESIRKFAAELCDVIGMKAYGEPFTPYFGENCEHTKGYSLLQFIETSSITGHFSEGTGGAYINIFSCMKYDCDLAESFTKKFFGAKKVVSRFTVRK